MNIVYSFSKIIFSIFSSFIINHELLSSLFILQESVLPDKVSIGINFS